MEKYFPKIEQTLLKKLFFKNPPNPFEKKLCTKMNIRREINDAKRFSPLFAHFQSDL